MFDLFRRRDKSVRILLGVLLGLVALSMLVYLIPGGPGSSASAAGENTVAVVGDQKISSQDVQRAIQRLVQNQSNLPKSFLANYVSAIVNQLVDGKAMAFKARELGLTVSDEELANMIQADFASQIGGQFDLATYQAALGNQGMTVAQYEQDRRDAYLGVRLESLELQSLVVSEGDAKKEYERKNAKVGLQYLAFAANDFVAKVNKDPVAIKAYFDKNRAFFQTPEKRDLDLITGSVADFGQAAAITDAELQRRYQQDLDSFRVAERAQVRHILIKTQGKPKEDWPKLKAKAEDLLKQLQKGADFAELAKKNSEDPGSGVKGGDLGWIVRGQTVPNFEKAAFSLKPKELSGLVETEFGYHIMQVMDRQEAHVQTVDEVKPQLVAEIQKDLGAENLKKAITAARAETVKNPSKAAEIAKKYNLKFFEPKGVGAGSTLPDVNTQPEVITSLFATPKGSVGEIVNLDNVGKSTFVIVTNIVPAHNTDFAEAEKEVVQRFNTAEALKLSRAAADAAAARAKKGESLEALGKEYGATVKTAAPFTIDGAAEGIGAASLVAAAFKANTGDVIGPIGATSGEFVCKVSEKIPADMTQFAKNKDAMIRNLSTKKRDVQQELFRDSVVADLKRRGKVKLNQDTINRMIAAYQS